MKKFLSVLCVLLLLCSVLTLSVSAAGSSADDPIVCAGKDFNMVKIAANETAYVAYTDTSGANKMQISVHSSANYVVTYGETVENSDADGYCNIVATPDANGTYLLSIQNNATAEATFFVSFSQITPYEISDSELYEGENNVTTLPADITLFMFSPSETAVFEVSVNNTDAVLSEWGGSVFYVTGLIQEAVDGKLQITCKSVGQGILIGLGGVSEANITITKIDDYIPPASIDYQEYVNKYAPTPNTFKLPDGELTKVDITSVQTVVLGDDGIYRYGSANGPVMFVDLTGVAFADLYECYYPSSGGQKADRMRGTYLDETGKTCGYDFLNAMQQYADSLDSEGFYYLTEDVANYLNMYGKDQGWFKSEFSPFEQIVSGAFVEESAWLVSAYYIANGSSEPEIPVEPDTPNDPDAPETPDEPDAPVEDEDEPQSPATGDVASFGAVIALALSSAASLIFCKKRN